jgi:bifunctional non-homologous end joining protein LigD
MLRLRPARPVDFIEPCQPTTAPKPPAGPGWIHEIKHDRYRMMARRDGNGIRILTRNGHDWSHRLPAVLAAVASLKAKSCLIDGEAVRLRPARACCVQAPAQRRPSET